MRHDVGSAPGVNKSGKHVLVEDRDAAERPARPLGKICFEFRMQCLDKGARERDFKPRASDRTLSVEVND